MAKQQAEYVVVRSTTRCLKEKYRNVIEKLQDELKSSNSSFRNATLDLQQKNKEIDELKCVIQVRLHSLTFFSREEGDMLEQIQDIVVPKIDRNLVKKNFKIKMMFEQMGDGGEKETDW